MNRIEILQTAKTSLWTYPEARIVHHEIRGFVKGDEYRNLLERGLDELKRMRGSKWLSDHRTYSAVNREDSAWSTNVWAPAAIEAGFRSWAIVVPASAIGQLSMKRFADFYAEQGLAVELLTTPEAGLEWLLNR